MKTRTGVAVLMAMAAAAVNAEIWECPDLKGGKLLGNFESASELWRCPDAANGREKLSGNGGPGCVLMKTGDATCQLVSQAQSTDRLVRVGMSPAEVEQTLGYPMHVHVTRDGATWTYRHVPSPHFKLVFRNGSLTSWRRSDS